MLILGKYNSGDSSRYYQSFCYTTRVVDELLRRHPLISDQVDVRELHVILGQLEATIRRNVISEVVEFGCYIGTTSLFLRRLLDLHKSDKQLHVYDSFEGLPPKTAKDSSAAGEQFRAGELRVSKKELLREFRKAHLRSPVVHKAWFSELTETDIPQQISFAYLDGDFYESIMDSLTFVWPRMSRGGIITVDDYGRDALPGATRAVQEFFARQNVELVHESSIAIIQVR